jgi:hypothetical protein
MATAQSEGMAIASNCARGLCTPQPQYGRGEGFSYTIVGCATPQDPLRPSTLARGHVGRASGDLLHASCDRGDREFVAAGFDRSPYPSFLLTFHWTGQFSTMRLGKLSLFITVHICVVSNGFLALSERSTLWYGSKTSILLPIS